MIAGVRELAPVMGNAAACRALGQWRGTWLASAPERAALPSPPTPRQVPPLALTLGEQRLLASHNSEPFVDTAPAAVHATLLDEGRYLGSVRTLYRLLAADGWSLRAKAWSWPNR